MNREIKFRAWDLKTNEWLWSSSDPLTKLNDDNWTGHEEHELIWLQYTGLKDKNGKEIYESDFVKYKNSVCVVYWDYAGFRIKPMPNTAITSHIELEVVGNIYENGK